MSFVQQQGLHLVQRLAWFSTYTKRQTCTSGGNMLGLVCRPGSFLLPVPLFIGFNPPGY